MKYSTLVIPTLREAPADAEIASHILLTRAGFIRRQAVGSYHWLPLGVRVLEKVQRIVRAELARVGAQEVLMPVVQPAELWRRSGRWDVMGPEMLRLADRQNRDYCLSPTQEEAVTDLFGRMIASYKQLPCNVYHIQTKFRDEIRAALRADARTRVHHEGWLLVPPQRAFVGRDVCGHAHLLLGHSRSHRFALSRR